MRRSQCEIRDQQKIREILSRARVGRLATLGSDGYPYITPVNFVFHKGCIYFHSAPEGEKLSNIGRDPRVCFEVDEPLAYLEVSFNEELNPCKVHQLYRSVVIRGTARQVPDGPLKTEVLNELLSKYEGRRDHPPVQEGSAGYRGCKVIEITIERMSAKADLLQGRPPELIRGMARKLRERGLPGDMEALEELLLEAGGEDTGKVCSGGPEVGRAS
jgi:nitroimidazol reductase NimA-like FMN-containing flavoprotein (pyridoxamine 5'-phosphate oxidase superfamily)